MLAAGLVPYQRIYGMKEPNTLPRLANNGSISKHLPEGTPYGLVGTSSFYKRVSYPNGVVPKGTVTSTYAGGNDPWKGLDPFTSHGNGPPLNWHNQGADVGLYTNDDIHAVRIVMQEPTTTRGSPRAAGCSTTCPRTASAFSERYRCGHSPGTRAAASAASILTAIPTPASSPKFPPTPRSPSRRSTSARHGAELGANLAPASPRRDASTVAAVTPTASSRRRSRRPAPVSPSTRYGT